MRNPASVLVCVLGACSGDPPARRAVHAPAPPPAAPAIERAEPLDAGLVQTIRLAAHAYRQWGRVDERPNIAPGLCRMPMRGDYGASSHVRISAAEDSPHDRKLYYLWASAKWDYLTHGIDGAHPIADGFTIVKESFAAVPKPAEPEPPAAPEVDWRAVRLVGEGDVPGPVTWLEAADGTRLQIGDATGLYVMMKLGAADLPGTDAGWIYGTIMPDGDVTSVGRVATCMGCHEDAGDDRLFGLQPTKELVPPPGPPHRGF